MSNCDALLAWRHLRGSFQPTLIDDKTRVKNVIVLGKPTKATEDFANLWDNQLVTLCEVIQQDKHELAGKVHDLVT